LEEAVKVTVEEPELDRVAGLKLAETPAGRPLAESVTLELYPSTAVSVTIELAELLAVTDAFAAAIVKLGLAMTASVMMVLLVAPFASVPVTVTL